MYSLFAEDQFTPTGDWTIITGGRVDKHTYTEWMISPRVAIEFTPTEIDTLKLLYSRSVRSGTEAALRKEFLASGDDGQVEDINTVELRAERQHTPNLGLAFSGYYSDYEILAFNGNLQAISEIGRLQFYGLEFEADWTSTIQRRIRRSKARPICAALNGITTNICWTTAQG